MLFYNILPKSKYFVALTGLVATMSYPLQATSAPQGQLSVSAIVTDTCTVDSTDLAFGGLDSQLQFATNASSIIKITCTSDKDNISVYLDNGINVESNERNMLDTTSARLLPYFLYTDDSQQNLVQPSVSISSLDTLFKAGEVVNLPIYGLVEAGNYTAGTYSDIVTITVTYGSDVPDLS